MKPIGFGEIKTTSDATHMLRRVRELIKELEEHSLSDNPTFDTADHSAIKTLQSARDMLTIAMRELRATKVVEPKPPGYVK